MPGIIINFMITAIFISKSINVKYMLIFNLRVFENMRVANYLVKQFFWVQS